MFTKASDEHEKNDISLSCITGISSKNIALEIYLKAFSSENKDFILYFLEKFEFNKYYFLVILQKVFPIGDLFETFDCLW